MIRKPEEISGQVTLSHDLLSWMSLYRYYRTMLVTKYGGFTKKGPCLVVHFTNDVRVRPQYSVGWS